MPYCPNCRAEFRPEFSICSDCGCALVDELPAQEEKGPEDYSFLINAADGIECQIIKSKLDSFDIPCQTLYRGAAHYTRVLFGSSFEGADLYVPTAQLQQARELLANNDLPEGEYWNE